MLVCAVFSDLSLHTPHRPIISSLFYELNSLLKSYNSIFGQPRSVILSILVIVRLSFFRLRCYIRLGQRLFNHLSSILFNALANFFETLDANQILLFSGLYLHLSLFLHQHNNIMRLSLLWPALLAPAAVALTVDTTSSGITPQGLMDTRIRY